MASCTRRSRRGSHRRGQLTACHELRDRGTLHQEGIRRLPSQASRAQGPRRRSDRSLGTPRFSGQMVMWSGVAASTYDRIQRGAGSACPVHRNGGTISNGIRTHRRPVAGRGLLPDGPRVTRYSAETAQEPGKSAPASVLRASSQRELAVRPAAGCSTGLGARGSGVGVTRWVRAEEVADR